MLCSDNRDAITLPLYKGPCESKMEVLAKLILYYFKNIFFKILSNLYSQCRARTHYPEIESYGNLF